MKNYTITEEQIKEIALGGGKTKIKEYFPEVFQPKETPEDFLNEIFKADFICKTDKEEYLNSVFYFDGETLLIEIKKRENKLYALVNYSKIWNPISSNFGLNYDQTKQLLKVRIEEHFKLRDVTPIKLFIGFYWKIEEHFKLRDVTPEIFSEYRAAVIEEHFKWRDVTPR